MFTETKIVIIGAGAAGIAAASRLIESGFRNTIILEAKNRIGGRINTVEFADNVVELGAQWVHGEEDNIVFKMASKHGLLDHTSSLSFTFFMSNGERIPEDIGNKLWIINEEIDNNTEILKTKMKSYDEVYTKEFYRLCQRYGIPKNDRTKLYLEWLFKINCTIQGCERLSQVSAQKLLDYKNCSGDLLIHWKPPGYKTLFSLFMKSESEYKDTGRKCLSMNHVELEKQVKSIDYAFGDDVLITTKDGTKYNANHVVFTPSLGVLKEEHMSLFKPLLPERKRRAIENIGIGTVNKFFLEFSDRWWPLDLDRICFLWTKEDKEEFITIYGERYRWLCDVYYLHSLPYQPRVLCGWLSGPFVKYPDSLSDSDVLKKLYILLQRFFGKEYTVLQPINMIRSRWFGDPCFRGSYSYKTLDTEKNGVTTNDLADPVLNRRGKPVVLFAGEATHDSYYSTVHGAIESGYREANRIINYYK